MDLTTQIDRLKVSDEERRINSKQYSTKNNKNYSEELFGDNFVYADLLGFRGDLGKFICKEFCLVDAKFVFHSLVKSSIEFHKLSSFYKRHAEVDTKWHHALSYDCGDVSIDELVTKVLPKIRNKIVLVYHSQKANWLRYIFRHHSKEIECVTKECQKNEIGINKTIKNVGSQQKKVFSFIELYWSF